MTTTERDACAENRVVLNNMPYKAYVLMTEANRDSSAPRIAYEQGRLEIVVPSALHEDIRTYIDLILSLIGMVWNIDFADYGTATYRRDDLERGFEPDISLYVMHAEAMRGREEIDLSRDPAPDLIVEVDISHPSMNKIPLYAKWGIEELWLYRNRTLQFLLRNGGEYKPVPHSRAFPTLDSETVNEFVRIAPTMPRPQWMRHVSDWAQTHLPENPHETTRIPL